MEGILLPHPRGHHPGAPIPHLFQHFISPCSPLQSPPALHPPKIHQGHQNHRAGAPSHSPMPLPPGVWDSEMLETSNQGPSPSVNSPQHHKSKLKPICSPSSKAQPRNLPASLGMRQAQGQPGNPTCWSGAGSPRFDLKTSTSPGSSGKDQCSLAELKWSPCGWGSQLRLVGAAKAR